MSCRALLVLLGLITTGLTLSSSARAESVFDTPHYTLMTLLESGHIAVGDRIRVVWRESLTKSESAELVWLPFKPWEPDEPSPTPEP